MVAAGKSEIREWFKKGVFKKHAYMIVIYDRMGYPDSPDFPLYVDTDEELSDMLRIFRHDELSEVMEVYDLSGDMEAQLNEKRAWHVPASLKEDEPEVFISAGLLASGETRIDYMAEQNAQCINEYFEDDADVSAYPARVFTHSTKDYVYETCIYILEHDDYAEKTVAAVYRFFEDNTAKAYDILLLEDMEGGESRFLAQFPLRQKYSVSVDGPYIKFRLVHAGGKDKYSNLYKQLHTTITRLYSEKYDSYGMDGMSGGYYLDEQSGRLFIQAMDFLNMGSKAQAVELLKKIAPEGHAEAMYLLGKIYYEGGISGEANECADDTEGSAIMYWQNAALIGHEKSARLVDLLTKNDGYKIRHDEVDRLLGDEE